MQTHQKMKNHLFAQTIENMNYSQSQYHAEGAKLHHIIVHGHPSNNETNCFFKNQWIGYQWAKFDKTNAKIKSRANV